MYKEKKVKNNIGLPLDSNKSIGKNEDNYNVILQLESLCGDQETIKAIEPTVLQQLSKPFNTSKIKLLKERQIIYDRGLRKIYQLKNLSSDTLFLSYLYSLKLIEGDEYYAPYIRTRRVFVYYIAGVTVEERQEYIQPFLSEKGLGKYGLTREGGE